MLPLHEKTNMVNLIFLYSILIVGLSIGTQAKFHNRIVGGNDASIEDYPYQISLLSMGQHICGGSIISPFYAVTAAHCTDGSDAVSLSVRYGSSIRNAGGLINPVSEIFQHPDYDKPTNNYDVSVLRFDVPFIESQFAQSIPLCSCEVPEGALTTISGWGDTVDGMTSPPMVLQAGEVPRVSDEECRRLLGENSKISFYREL